MIGGAIAECFDGVAAAVRARMRPGQLDERSQRVRALQPRKRIDGFLLDGGNAVVQRELLEERDDLVGLSGVAERFDRFAAHLDAGMGARQIEQDGHAAAAAQVA
jgi:hypothetical protein